MIIASKQSYISISSSAGHPLIGNPHLIGFWAGTKFGNSVKKKRKNKYDMHEYGNFYW